MKKLNCLMTVNKQGIVTKWIWDFKNDKPIKIK